MPIFPKVIQETGGKNVDLKTSLEERLKAHKLRELDEAAIETNVQSSKTKTAELEAKEVEAQSRKVSAEANIMDKFMPQGIWSLLSDVLKDKNPQAPMTVEDMLTIMEYARGQQGAPQAEQPTEGMWGFLSTMMERMVGGDKTTTPLELIETIGKVNSMMHPPQQQGSVFSQFTEFANLMTTMKQLFAPAQSSNPLDLVNMPGGGAMSFQNLLEWQKQGFDLQLKRDEFEEKRQSFKTARENVPEFLETFREFIDAIRGEKPKSSGDIGKKVSKTKQLKEEKEETQELICPDCKMPFAIPAGIEGNVGCPRCTMQVLERLEATKNAGENDTSRGKSTDAGKQGEDTGLDGIPLP